MLALHGRWATDGAGSLLVWAEDGEQIGVPHLERGPGSAVQPERGVTDAGSPARRRRRTARQRSVPHPFAATAEALAAALDHLPPAPANGRLPAGTPVGETVELVVWLPGSADGPEPSPQVVPGVDGVGPGRRRPTKPRPYEVPAVAVHARRALEVLGAAADEAPEGLRFGASLLALARLGDLAHEIVAGGRVVPSLVLDDAGTAFARWEPSGHPDDTARLGQLAAALPTVAWDHGDVPAPAAVALALRALVDARCRLALEGTHLVEPSRNGTRPIVERWLAALSTPEGFVPGEPGELVAWSRTVAQWRAPVEIASGSWRLCFRLREPAPTESGSVDAQLKGGAAGTDGPGAAVPSPADERWHIDLMLQATDDPSLLVDAAAVWRSGDTLRQAARSIHEPQEVMLAELGRAERVFPELGDVLRHARPTDVELDAAGAHHFLSTVAPALEVAGFGVLLPSWWGRPAGRLALRLHASTGNRSAGGGRLGLDGLAMVDWQAALGDEVLDLRELRRLAALKAPLVRVRGQWVELRHDDVAALVTFLEDGRRRERMSMADVLRAAAGAGGPVPGIVVTSVSADGLLESFLAGTLEAALDVRETPEGFRAELRPYQRRAVAWIELLEKAGLGACLADDMGLGKTATVLAVVQGERVGRRGPEPGQRRRTRRGRIGPTLVVCPTSVVGNWRAEAARFAPDLDVVVHHGSARPRGDELAAQVSGADVVVTSYPLVERDRAALAAVPWHRMVLDEAQQVKNPAAKQTKAVRALAVPRRLALTGTPVENHLGDLWSIMEILNPGLLGSESSFRERFAVPIERFGDDDAVGKLRTLTRPFMLRRLKTDRSIIDDLPEKLETTERCTLTREQATLYQAVVDEMLEQIDGAEGMERKGLVLATMLRLKQVCNHPAQFLGDGSAAEGRSGKLERVVEVLDEVRDAGEKALVFTQFAEMGAILQRHLHERLGCRVSFLHGGVPRGARDRMVAEMQEADGVVPVMVLSLKAGGTGINLTAANHVVHYDRWWNPAVEQQATDRAYRIGQRRDVQVRTLVCGGTIEERIAEMIESKRALADQIVGTGESWLTELSTEDLAAVLRLSAEVAAA